MPHYETTLSTQEKKWLSEGRITRLTDNNEVLIYPMGAERYLSLVLFGNKEGQYNIKTDIEGKNVLVIPGYGNSSFLFALAGAESVTVLDKDPVTIAWVKAFKKYYNFREYNANGQPYPSVGDLLTALTCWYPPLVFLPSGKIKSLLCWAIRPKSLRRLYIFYMMSLVNKAIQSQSTEDYELHKDIKFCTGELNQLLESKEKPIFDTAFVPYLLGVENGIESTRDIVHFIKHLTQVVPRGRVLVTPARNTKEFHVAGQQYFVTTEYSNIQSIPELKSYIIGEDNDWFKTQGLAIFGKPNPNLPTAS